MNTLKSQDKAEFYIKRIVKVIKKYNPEKIILFGSRARGDNKKISDIDIAVDMDISFREQRKLKEEVDNVSGLYSVDLIFLPKIDENFRNKILKEGKILYEKK